MYSMESPLVLYSTSFVWTITLAYVDIAADINTFGLINV